MLLVGLVAGRAWSAPDPIACRNRIAQSQLRLLRVGLREIDGCHRRLNRGRPTGECNVLPLSSDTPFPRSERRMRSVVPVRCPPELVSVRGNFPACTQDGCDNILTTVVPDVRFRLEENANALLTPSPLGPPFAECQRAVAKARSAVVRAVTKRAFACQRRLDRSRGGFGSLAAECVLDAGPVAEKAERRIRAACLGVDPTPLATCAPLPGCVVEIATAMGRDLAKLAYGSADRCGDGALDPGEACDDGNDVATDACTDTCRPATCGDGIVWQDVEECDDGNLFPTDGCDASCRLPVCGDGIVAGGEECDDGNAVPDDGCTECRIDPVYCGAGGLRAFVDYDDPSSTAAAAGTIQVKYPAAISIPGSGPLRGPVVNTSSAGNATFLPRDADTDADGVDDAVEVVFALANDPWPVGSFASIDFTCAAGTPVLAPDLPCRLLSASDLFSNALDPAALRCAVVDLEPIP